MAVQMHWVRGVELVFQNNPYDLLCAVFVDICGGSEWVGNIPCTVCCETEQGRVVVCVLRNIVKNPDVVARRINSEGDGNVRCYRGLCGCRLGMKRDGGRERVLQYDSQRIPIVRSDGSKKAKTRHLGRVSIVHLRGQRMRSDWCLAGRCLPNLR